MQKKILLLLMSVGLLNAKSIKTKHPKLEKQHEKQEKEPIHKNNSLVEPLKSNTHFVIGLGAGGMQQNDQVKADEDAGNSFTHINQPYAVNCGIGSLHIGIQTVQGITYLGAFLYGYTSPLNKEIYRSNLDADTLDYLSVNTNGAVGLQAHFGVKIDQITPYGLIGIQHGPRSVKYVSEDPDPAQTANITYKNKQPTFVFGIGLKGDISQNLSLGLEMQRQVSHDFNVKLPPSNGRIGGDFLHVKTARWLLQATLSYKFDLG